MGEGGRERTKSGCFPYRERSRESTQSGNVQLFGDVYSLRSDGVLCSMYTP